MQLTLATSVGPLYRQVFETLREALLSGRWQAGQRLPASRELAAALAVSRNTVNTAYDMLRAEGYVSARQGSGYYVTADLPEAATQALVSDTTVASPATQTKTLSRAGAILARHTRPTSAIPNPAFQPGLPEVARFPFRQWQQCLQARSRRQDPALTHYQEAGGHPALKQTLCDYLRLSRGVQCEPEQIVVVSGSQAGLDLLARMLIDPGQTIAIEEPGYLGARDAFSAAGANLLPVPVDAEGLQVDALAAAQEPVKLVYSTPSYQFPLGLTMSVARRLQLLQWADANDAFIIEDDYDSEFRYRERPLSSLQGLDSQQRVIYLGTFSKVIFPGLRMGYLVLPPAYARDFALALRKTGQDPPLIWQAALADFISHGHFASHLRKMRKLYGEKQEVLVDLLQRQLGDWLHVQPTAAGMQLACDYRRPVDEARLLEAARQQAINLSTLARYYIGRPTRQGLYLGYAGVPREVLADNVRKLEACFRKQEG